MSEQVWCVAVGGRAQQQELHARELAQLVIEAVPNWLEPLLKVQQAKQVKMNRNKYFNI